ncbi:OLC1v1003116C1 [Oldenlandia corymbosa var. corymbosa]|uniref:OLC1v1003116C1 n=1 Tax=Oldenlandia corymbosa var. corymbosa TaxID=529605 RepID=A0AAV1DA42_OLDCO|nr:OLC1v1003116C1 [Oldenlandia corymbosa var. corymbosa]
MTISTTLHQILLLISLLLLSIFMISAAAAAAAAAAYSFAPSFPPSVHEVDHLTAYPATLFASILASLGFQELSSAAINANLSTTTPVTIFAPSDSSLLTCPSCSVPLLLQEHAVPGLYSLDYLRKLAFGTKIETLSPDYCLTVTNSAGQNDSSKSVFVNGVEISHPDMFYNGAVMVHGLQGFVSHLSPLSCNVERLTSLSFPQPWLFKAPTSSVMRLMLKDAIIRLRFSGYSIVSLALKVKFAELSQLKAMTVFALDDVAIFSGAGQAYLHHFRFHVVPNRRLTAAVLVSLQPATVLPTMEIGQNLVVTTAGGGGPLAPMKINYVKVTTLNLLHNSRIVVHAVSTALPHMHHHLSGKEDPEAEYNYDYYHVNGDGSAPPPTCDLALGGGMCEVEAPAPGGINSVADNVFHLGDSVGL